MTSTSRPPSPAAVDNEKGKGGDYAVSPAVIKDDVFGDITDDGPNYRNVSVLGHAPAHPRQVSGVGALVLLTKTNFGLGVLTIPSVLGTFGIVPGIILIFAMMGLTTCEVPCWGLADAHRLRDARWTVQAPPPRGVCAC